MKKISKKLYALLLGIALSVSALPTSLALANVATEQETIEQGIHVQQDSASMPNERTNYIILESPISTASLYWDQPSGFSYYRAFVTNTKDEDLKVVIDYDGTVDHTFTVKANSSYTLKVSNAKAKRHTVSFSSASGKVSGNITVRVSDQELD